MLSVVGPNGSGKSTLVKLISGELLPSSGFIFFDRKCISKYNPSDLALKRSVLSQSNNLSFPFSVIDIVKMGRFTQKDKRFIHNDEAICGELLKIFDLQDYINRNYMTLSGGEKQRVQLARVIAQIWSLDSYNKKLLILDEPTSYLDIKHQASLFDFLKVINKKGLTIILVLHDLNLAVRNSNKILMLKNSKLVKYGYTNDVLKLDTLKSVFDVDLDVFKTGSNNKPLIVFK
tara:strand:+ start:22173 stop:22868 length:696 start_codon:yes stop_codon:yes gene_type:complete